mgnify:CR=1 FL=1
MTTAESPRNLNIKRRDHGLAVTDVIVVGLIAGIDITDQEANAQGHVIGTGQDPDQEVMYPRYHPCNVCIALNSTIPIQWCIANK